MPISGSCRAFSSRNCRQTWTIRFLGKLSASQKARPKHAACRKFGHGSHSKLKFDSMYLKEVWMEAKMWPAMHRIDILIHNCNFAIAWHHIQETEQMLLP